MKLYLHKYRTLYTLLLFALSTYTAFAQPAKLSTKISGSLIDEQNKPLAYATASLLRAKDSSIVKGALTNETGNYVFDHIINGDYIVRATVVGYSNTFSKPFTINESTHTVAVPQMKLQPATRNLSTVNIVAAKPLIERKSDRTVMNVENSVLAAGNSAMDILERAPGVTIDKDDNITLRGKQGVTVMINDKLTYLSSTELAALLRSTDGITIQSIEIITNPSAKYDAAGNSGIINIKLKKNKQSGTNGSITSGVGYGHYGKDNNTLNLNHKEGKLNIFSTFGHSNNKRDNELDIFRIVTNPAGETEYFDQYSKRVELHHNNNYRIGADYDITSKHTIGFQVNGYFNKEYDDNNNNTYIGTTPNVVDTYQNTVTDMDQSYKNFAANLNDRLKIDTAGQELAIDLDYSKFKNNTNASYITNFYSADGTMLMEPSQLRNQTPSVIDIRTAKADYTLPLNKTLKLEAGAKYGAVKTDNNLQAQIYNSGTFVNDTTRSNRFVYDEKIEAAYFSLTKSYKKTSVQAGLRAEYTQSTGTLVGRADIPVHRSYLNFFPSVFINHTINDKNEIGLNYSRRIDRPGYDDLNPFIYYLDQYTFSQGNPFLRPQYTNSFELNYTYNHTFNVGLGYSRTTDAITELVLTVGERTFETHRNLQTQENYSININTPYTINKWWSGDFNATGFYLSFKSDTLIGAKLDQGKPAFQLRSTQTLLVAKGYKAEVTGYYQSALVYGIFDVKPQYSVDAGVSHSFWNKKANLKFMVSDIFNIRRNDVSSNYGNNDFVIKQKRETRIARLTFTYNFGNTKIKSRQHRSGADDEAGRVKGNN